MSGKQDYYDVLGVGREASTGEIRKAYKKLALQFHPDRNQGDDEAESQFKSVTEAYQVLSDDQKRQRYDQFGHAGLEGGAGAGFQGDIFSHFQDIFSDFFGGGFGGGSRQASRARRGRDMGVTQALSLEEAILGCKKEIELHAPTQCETCEGSGAKPGSRPKRCATCAGAGQVSTGRGFVVFTQPCPSCGGEGSVIDDPCHTCDGAGWTEATRKVSVTFPPGIDQGHRLRVAGQGLPSTSGGPPGHLYVDVALEAHPIFERQGDDLITRRTISYPAAALGDSMTIELIGGSDHEVSIEAGTQPGTIITIAGKGTPSVNGPGRGALHVVIQVDVPRELSREARRILKTLREELSGADENEDEDEDGKKHVKTA